MRDLDRWFNRIVGIATILSILIPIFLPYITTLPLSWSLYIVIICLIIINITLFIKHRRRHGILRITVERDSNYSGKKSFDFLERINRFRPKKRLILIGFSVEYMPKHLNKQLEKLIHDYPDLIIEVCILNPSSICTKLRSIELFGEELSLKSNINESIKRWKVLQNRFPDRIVLKKSDNIPYAEYEAIDINEKGYIYYVPVSYKKYANITPSYFLNPKSELYNFHKSTIEQILRDAKSIN